MKNVWKWDTPEWGNVFTAASHVNLKVIELKSHDLTFLQLLKYLYKVGQLQKRDWERPAFYTQVLRALIRAVVE